MNQENQSAIPDGNAAAGDWMQRVKASLERGEKAEYDDLEAGVHELLSMAAAARKAPAIPAAAPAAGGGTNFDNLDWIRRIDASLTAGQKPAYADVEEGLNHLLQENVVLKEFIKDSKALITAMVVARADDDTDALLAALDEFVRTHVTIEIIPPAGKTN